MICSAQHLPILFDRRVPVSVSQAFTRFPSPTERCGNLAEKSNQAQFLEVQLELLHDFIARLNIEAEERSWAPVEQHFCSVLNAACYATLILQEWSEQTVCRPLTGNIQPILTSLRSWRFLFSRRLDVSDKMVTWESGGGFVTHSQTSPKK